MALPAAALLLVLGATPGSASAATLAVDDDGAQCTDAGYTSVQAAVEAAAPGDTVAICPGTYTEGIGAAGTNALTIRKSLTLKGAGADLVTIRPARRDENPGSIQEASPNLRNGIGDVVAVVGTPALPVTADISGVTISGGGVQVEAGVVYVDAQGSLRRSRVTNIITSDLASAETTPGGWRNGDFGVGVAQVTAATTAPATNPVRTLTVDQTRIDRYNKTGLQIDGATNTTPPLTASGVPNRGVVTNSSIVGRNLCTNAPQNGNCANPQPVTDGRLFGQDGILVTAGSALDVTGTLVSQNIVHGTGAPQRTTQQSVGNNTPIPPLTPNTTNNGNLRLAAGIRLIGAAASTATRSNIVDNAYGAYNADLDGTTANTTTPFTAEVNWWGLRYFPGNNTGQSPNNPTTNPGPEVSPAYNPPIPENPVNGTESADGEGRTSTAVDFSPHRAGFQGDEDDGEFPVAEAPLPVNDTAPTVALDPGADEAERGDDVELVAETSDDFGIRSVTFYDGATPIGTASGNDPTVTYAVPLDAACGDHTLTAVAEDSSGQTAVSAPQTLTIDCPAAPQEPNEPEQPVPPVVTGPGTPPGGAPPGPPGAPVLPNISNRGGTLFVPADGVARVDVFLGTRRICTVTAAPFRCFVRPTGADVGQQILRVVVTDLAGRTSETSRRITIARFRARSLRLTAESVTRRRGRAKAVTGEVGLPSVVTARQGCDTGRVTVVLKRNGTGIANVQVPLRADCTFRRTFTLPPREAGTRYTLKVRFGGNDVLLPRSSSTRRFR